MLKRKYSTLRISRIPKEVIHVTAHILLPLFLLSGIFACGRSSLGSDAPILASTEISSNRAQCSESSNTPDPGSKTPIDFLTSSDQIKNSAERETFFRSFIPILGSLALVLCTFLGLVYITKHILPRQRRKLSSSIEIIDSCFVDHKNELTTIRWGGKLILLGKSHGSFSTLSELSDKEQIDAFFNRCSYANSKAVSSPITRLFKCFSSEKERNVGEK